MVFNKLFGYFEDKYIQRMKEETERNNKIYLVKKDLVESRKKLESLEDKTISKQKNSKFKEFALKMSKVSEKYNENMFGKK